MRPQGHFPSLGAGIRYCDWLGRAKCSWAYRVVGKTLTILSDHCGSGSTRQEPAPREEASERTPKRCHADQEQSGPGNAGGDACADGGTGSRARDRQTTRSLADNEPAVGYYVGLTRCTLGEKDEAIEWLERAEQSGLGLLIVVAVEPSFSPLRPVPRFQALLRKLGLA